MLLQYIGWFKIMQLPALYCGVVVYWFIIVIVTPPFNMLLQYIGWLEIVQLSALYYGETTS